jgi:hypothetical protein
MAVKTSWYATDTALGINFNLSYLDVVNIAASVTSNSTTSDLAESAQLLAPDLLGTCRRGTDASDWILLKASTTITQFMVVMFDDGYKANPVTSAGIISGYQLAVCQVQTYGGVSAVTVDPGANPVFWGALKGVGMQVAVSGSAGTGVALNNAASAGYLTISTTGTGVRGIVLYASPAASNQNVECMVLYPHSNLS